MQRLDELFRTTPLSLTELWLLILEALNLLVAKDIVLTVRHLKAII